MRFRSDVVAGFAVLSLALAGMPAQAQVTFKGFGVIDAFVSDMSADRSVVVGGWVSTLKSKQAFRWTAAGGVEDIGGNMDTVAVSRDGRTIVGSALDTEGNRNAAIWQGGKEWKTLGGIPGGSPQDGVLSVGYAVSGDGSTIVGLAYLPGSTELGTQARGFRWDAVNGMADLGALQQGSSSAVAISADGHTIVGWDSPAKGAVPFVPGGRRGAIFWEGLERLIHAFGRAGEAQAVSYNGAFIVGAFNPIGGVFLPSGDFYPAVTTYLYTAWDGHFEDLGAAWQEPRPLSDYSSSPNGVSDDGKVVIGTSGFDPLACIWTRATGMVLVKDYLTANGVTDHQGWKLTNASYVSPDGKVIAGTGINPQLRGESWIVTLP